MVDGSVITGVAVVPTAPLLVPGVGAGLGEPLARVVDAVRAVLQGLPPADAAVLVTGGNPAMSSAADASLACVGRPDVAEHAAGSDPLAAALAAATGQPRIEAASLALGASVLALLVRRLAPTAPLAAVHALLSLSVAAGAAFDHLAEIGSGIARASDARLAILAAGDLSAGLTERSPLHRVPGAEAWDQRAVAVVDSGRMRGLGRLGPEEARRVGALGWAPLAVVHGVCAGAKIGMVVRHYAAPRGVGYLVACGA